MGRNHKYIRLENRRFGLLTVLRREGQLRRVPLWRCRCDCGEEIVERSDRLRSGSRKACARNGHTWRSTQAPPLTKKYPSEYSSWQKMWRRCKAKKGKNYKYYGALGVTVCERWKEFKNFVADMGAKPTPKHSIDRYPNANGNYEPTNCRWATHVEQMRNRRNAVFVEYEGERILLADLIDRLGVSKTLVRTRLALGWSLADALTIPIMRYKKKRRRK